MLAVVNRECRAAFLIFRLGVRFEIAALAAAVAFDVALLTVDGLDVAEKGFFRQAGDPARRSPMFENKPLLHVRLTLGAFVVAHAICILCVNRITTPDN